jgi:hypothetical protein
MSSENMVELQFIASGQNLPSQEYEKDLLINESNQDN